MKAIHLTAHGQPTEVLHLVDIPDPAAPDHHQVLIQMEYSPICFTDLLLAQGLTFHPELPGVIGDEGVGTILAVGNAASHLKVGDRATIPYGTPCWAERILAPIDNIFVVPPRLDIAQASMLSINPVTAVLMIDEFIKLQKGEWVVFNAANSALGHCVVAVAKARGLKTAGIVRRAEVADELLDAGADVVLVDSADVVAQMKGATNDEPIRLGLDGVGGEATNTIARILELDSHILIYAMRSGQFSVIDQAELIFKRMKVHGFWMYYPQYQTKFQQAMAECAELILSERLHMEVAATYALKDIKKALEHASTGGKVLLAFQE